MEKRWLLTTCKRCGVLWKNHGTHRGGVRHLNGCFANAFVDFNRVPVVEDTSGLMGEGI